MQSLLQKYDSVSTSTETVAVVCFDETAGMGVFYALGRRVGARTGNIATVVCQVLEGGSDWRVK